MSKVRLFEACDFTMGQSSSSESYNSEGRGIPFYQGNADFGKRTPVTRVWCDSPKKKANAGDILLSVRAPIGAINVAVEECCIGRGLAALTPKEGRIDPEYLQHFLRYLRPDLERQGTGSTFKAIGKSVLSKLELPLPSVLEQATISENLNLILVQQDRANESLGMLDELVKSRFIEMFGDPDTNPKAFETKAGAKLFKIGNGKAKPSSERFEKGIPAYGGNGISWYTNEALVDHTTIVIGRVGRHCGNTRLVEEPCWVTDNAMFIKDFKDASFDLTFLSWLMVIIGFNRFADKGDLWKITQKPFMEYDFYIPPLALQQEFAAFVQQVDKLEFETQQAIDKLQMLYDSLAQEYFTMS